MTAYLVALAGLLLVGGALGDRYGRRRVFVIGVVWFAVSSTVCTLAPDTPLLVAGRASQGVGGTLLMPGSLAILQASFAEDDRPHAIGAWSGLGGVATAVGPFLGGFLIGAVSWRLIFLINLPLSIVVVAIATRHVPERATRPRWVPSTCCGATLGHPGPGRTGGRAHRGADRRLVVARGDLHARGRGGCPDGFRCGRGATALPDAPLGHLPVSAISARPTP